MITTNKKAFTLAEVLITLTVIGIVASLTIPSLIHNTQYAEMKSAFKKTYSDLDAATRLLMIDNAGTLVGIVGSSDVTRDKYLAKMNFIKKCDFNQDPGICWHNANQ